MWPLRKLAIAAAKIAAIFVAKMANIVPPVALVWFVVTDQGCGYLDLSATLATQVTVTGPPWGPTLP